MGGAPRPHPLASALANSLIERLRLGQEQIFLINRLIKPKSVLIANIEDFGGSKGLPMIQAVRVHPAGGRATFVIRNIATHPADQVDGRYSVSWSIFN